MRIYFVRHGQTDFNAGKVYASGDIDHELNEIGIEQAQQARNQLKDTSFDIIISSPLRRAKKTAEIINEYHGQEIQFDERIKERYAGALSKAPSLDEWNKLFDFDDELIVEGSERASDFFERVYSFLNDLSTRYGDQTILVVSHGGVRHAFHAYFHQLPWKGNLRINRTENGEIIEFDSQNRRREAL